MKTLPSRKRKSLLQADHLLSLLNSAQFSALARYTTSLKFIGTRIHLNIIPVNKALILSGHDLKKVKKSKRHLADEREENVKSMGSQARSLSPPGNLCNTD
jgi:hypothetical protein